MVCDVCLLLVLELVAHIRTLPLALFFAILLVFLLLVDFLVPVSVFRPDPVLVSVLNLDQELVLVLFVPVEPDLLPLVSSKSS